MKKFICTCLTALVVLGIQFAFASGIIDFSTYSDEELITIVAELNDELVARGIGKSAVVHPGDYLIGRDLPAGHYILTEITEEHPYVIIYTDEKKEDCTYANNFYSAGGEVSITVEEGQILQIRHQNIKLTISAGIVFQ